MGPEGKLTVGFELAASTVRIMRRYLPPSLNDDDLLSDAHLGLLKAIRQFDPSRGVPFRAYAIQRIRGAILDGLRERDWTPRGATRLRRMLTLHPLSCQLPTISHPDRLEDSETLRKALRTLPRRNRLVLQLSYLEHMTLKDIGRCFGMTEAAISIARRNALRRLAEGKG